MLEPPKQIEHLFRAAGWDGLARTKPDPSICVDHPAYPIIESFDGLHVRHEMVNELGSDSHDADIEFKWLPSLWPSAAAWTNRLNVQFVGVGLTRRSYSQLWVSNDGRYFYSNDISDHFEYIADNWETAIVNVLKLSPTRVLLETGTRTIPGDERFYDWPAYLD